MSNFQRTRSKVWWGDTPPNIGSPVAQAADWNRSSSQEEQEWQPQLPHWIGNEPEEQKNNNQNNMPPQNDQQNQWPLRHGSPGSHKSQDSGFSDSDNSPPPSQYYASPETVQSKISDASSSSSDSNNNQNITVKRVTNNNTSKDEVDEGLKPEDTTEIPTPKARLRSSSVIQTPYDLQKYYEVHNDQEHMELLKDRDSLNDLSKNNETNISIAMPRQIKNDTKTPPIKPVNQSIPSSELREEAPRNNNYNKENILRSHTRKSKDISNDSQKSVNASEKYPTPKSFIRNQENDNMNIVKVAKVKDLETNKNKSQDSLEYIKLSDNNEIAVNNQPRIRSPISNVSYIPTERSKTRSDYRRSVSIEDQKFLTTSQKFQRSRLNKSLNYEGQRLDQQILDIQDGCHSLGYIADDHSNSKEMLERNSQQIHQPTKAWLGKNITDSLLLKPNKKIGPKSKQRLAAKIDKIKGQGLNFFPPKKEKPGVVSTHAGGILEGSRVPSLGLPRSNDLNQWVVVGYPEGEKLISNYNERLVESDIPSKNGKITNIPPPPEFQDKRNENCSNTTRKEILTYDTKREKLKEVYDNFIDVQMNLACTSTPKMLQPHEYMKNVQTSESNQKKSRTRLNFLDNFSGIILNNQNELMYRERSIDQTALERLCERKPEPVQHWLCDLISSCENECMTTLQSKPLGAEMKALVSSSTATITGNIKKVQTHGQIIVHQYSDMIRQLEQNNVSEEHLCLLVANINEFVLTHSISLNTKPPGETPERWDKIKKSLQVYLQKLIEIGEDIKIELNESNPEWSVVQKHLDNLIGIFSETTKAVLIQQLKTLVSIIEEPPSDIILKSTLTSIGHLAMLTEKTESSLHEKCMKTMKGLTELPFVDCGIPRALLTAIIESNKSSIKALSLRALATVCVTGDAVKQFEEGGGIEIISDILNDKTAPEPQKREAITVLTQITAPWLRGHYDLEQLHLYLESIVSNMTGIIARTDCCQLLLLCTACLVNLVRELELENKKDKEIKQNIVEMFGRYKTVERLLEAVKKRGPGISVFLQEQTAALLAGLSRASHGVRLLCGVSSMTVALVCFARAAPAHTHVLPPRTSELRAHARLYQHAAEAISRLCAVPDVASKIVQLEGVPHLIRLVRMQRTRPQLDINPDQTLIYGLKALRTLYRHHPEAFEEYPKDVKEMIRPHLMESLMHFSVKQESYV